MQRQLYLLSFGISAALLGAYPAQAQNVTCAEHAQVVARLADHYGESRQSMGLARNNTLVEVFASRVTGSWTITVTQPGGLTCLVAAGQAYQYLNDPLVQGEQGA